jgi:hypothetical protein
VLQVAFAALCLPPTGSGTATGEKKKAGDKKKRKKQEPGLFETASRTISVRTSSFMMALANLGT